MVSGEGEGRSTSGTLHLTMNNKTKYLYVVNPANLTGVTFLTSFEAHRLESDEVAVSGQAAKSAGSRNGENQRKWTQPVVRLFKGAQRLGREYLVQKGRVILAGA